ncbi:hypothetical protein VTK56DRAFT_1911 [Thermocarpiscus australiensis]
MYPYRGRSGPSKATPSNVQCQKCLKRGHYSYECKAAPQERPYVPRPSRTQQLFNPKLQPKLSSEVPDVLQKKGVADEELAKREAERARKREREMEEETALRDSPPPRRGRSPSYDSVSSVSTRSPSPAPRRNLGPRRRERTRDDGDSSPTGSHARRQSFDSDQRHPRGLPESPERDYSRRRSRFSRSPSPRPSRSPPRQRGFDREHGGKPPAATLHRARRSGSYGRRTYSRSRSRSPRLAGRRERGEAGYYRDRDDGDRQGGGAPPPPPGPRERSLSPFSRRLALTQAMNMGR